MLIEERCYVLHATSSPADFMAAYRRSGGMELQTRILGGLVGYCATEIGAELNAIVSLWRYDSFEDRLKRRALLAAEPGWQRYLDEVRPMIRSMSNRLMNRLL